VRPLVRRHESTAEAGIIEQRVDALLAKHRLGLIEPVVRPTRDQSNSQLRVIAR
jgi:hypothetical protein